MAETVKKSRIVSDGGNHINNNRNNNSDDKEDDFGDVLMEEFNLILKNCMSQDNLQKDTDTNNDNNDDDDKQEEEEEEPYYDNIEIIKNNQHIISSREFIKIEKENYYEEPSSVLLKNGNNNGKQLNQQQNGHKSDGSSSLYENIVVTNHNLHLHHHNNHLVNNSDAIDKTDKKLDQYVDMTQNLQQQQSTTTTTTTIVADNYEIIDDVKQSVIDEDADQLPEYEDIIDNNLEGNNHIKIITINDDLNDDDDDVDHEKPIKSIKDRMLLSTDAQPCLFFTQTVTSPMLTPSEENIDFLKAFRQTDGIDDDDDVADKNAGGGGDGNQEKIYENGDFLKQQPPPPDVIIYENLQQLKENIYENVVDLKTNQQTEVELQHTNNDDDDDDDDDNDKKMEHKEEEVSIVDVTTKPRIVESLKSQFSTEHITTIIINDNNNDDDDNDKKQFIRKDGIDGTLKSVDIMKQINKFEGKVQQQDNDDDDDDDDDDSQMTESYVETTFETTTTTSSSLTSPTEKCLKKKKSKKSRKEEKENISVKSSFNKFDALQKKNVLHIRSSDSSKAQEKFNGQISQIDNTNCRACDKAVFQMEQIKAEKSIWHRNCFRCKECNKQLTVDSYQSHEGTLYCKPHFKALFAPKAVEDDEQPKSRKPELIIIENQPVELPPDVVRASDKPDLGLEELQSLNVKERFQVFELHQQHQQQQHEMNEIERQQQLKSPVNVKRSPSILSKLARFQAKGMDIGVADDSLNGIPIEESSSDDNDDDNDHNDDDDNNDLDDGLDVDDVDLIRAKRVQKEKPFHFVGMSDVKNKWENVEQINSKDERREERKQEIQSIRNRLFMGKQGKMKEAYQQAVMESESCVNLKREQEPLDVCDKTKSLKEKFEKGEVVTEKTTTTTQKDNDDVEVFESEISKKSRSLFLELDANASKPPQLTPIPTPKLDVKRAREVPTPDREIYHDPEIVRSEELIEDSIIAKEQHTATKMLSKFREMEENLTKEQQPVGMKPLKCFTPPPEPAREETATSDEEEDDDDDDDDEDDDDDDNDEDDDEMNNKIQDDDLIEAQKAARAKQLRAKFERWEANEIKKEQANGVVNIAEEIGGDEQSIESTRTLRARFESMRATTIETNRPKVKVNRFVDIPNVIEICESCKSRVYPLEKISIHERIYHKNCFKCMECNCVLRIDSYSYNQGLLYCMPHFKRLFITKGNYDSAFGLGQQNKDKWNATVA